MKIQKVTKDDSIFKEIVECYYEWWGKKYYLCDEFYSLYLSYIKSDGLPNIYALVDSDILIGMYEINEHDRIEVDYAPFLANVFVKEEFRGKGYSRLLINDSIEQAKKMGCDYFYLRSRHENLYEKYGFELICEVETSLGKKRIFRKLINKSK